MTIFKLCVSGAGAAGDEWTSGLHASGTLSEIDATAAWLTAVEAIFTVVKEYWANTTSSAWATCYTLNATTGRALTVRRMSFDFTGIGGTQQPSPRECLVVGLRTLTPGPKGRGRMYLPSLSRDNLSTTGLFLDGPRDAIAGAFAEHLWAMQESGLTPGIWRKPVAVDDPVMTVVDPFDGVSVSQVPGTQRRRSNKIGADYRTATLG